MNRDRLSMARRQGDDFENSELFLEVQAALGRKIKRLREQRGMTQRQLASIADISGPHFGLIEAGVGNVSLLVLVKIAKALGVPVSDLFEGIGSSRSAMDSAIVRLAANLEKAVDHLRRRTDEIARFANDFGDFMQAYAERKEQEEPRPAEGERVPDVVRKRGRQRKGNPPAEG